MTSDICPQLHGRSREQRYTKMADWDMCAMEADPVPCQHATHIPARQIHLHFHGASVMPTHSVDPGGGCKRGREGGEGGKEGGREGGRERGREVGREGGREGEGRMVNPYTPSIPQVTTCSMIVTHNTCRRLTHIAISPHVTSAPNSLQNGRLPTFG